MASAAPPTEFFPGINFNLSFFTAGDSSVTLNYVNNNFLKCTGYAYSRSIATTFNGILYCLGGIDTTTITASGLITSTTGFKGSGAQLTNLNASNISGGTLNVNIGGTGVNTFGAKRLLIGNDTNPITTTANLVYDTSTNTLYPINIGANGSKLTNLNVSNVTDGTLTVSRGGTGATNFTSDRILLGNGTNAITESGNLTFSTTTNTLTATNISGIHSGTGTALTALNASNISSGTLTVSNGGTGLTSLPFNKILIGYGTEPVFTSSFLTWDDSTNSLVGKFAGTGTALTGLNVSNVTLGTLTVANGGTGLTSLTANRILIGSNTTVSQSSGLVFNPSTFTLTATNIAGAGAAITDLNVSNVSYGTLPIAYGGSQWNTYGTFNKINYLAGNVGIGVTDPIYTLDISGNLYSKGAIVTDGGFACQTGNATISTYLGVNSIANTLYRINVVGTTRTTTLTATNIGIGITNPTTSALEIVSNVITASDLINMRYDSNNGLRIQQAYVAANDFKQIFYQKNNSVDTAAMTIYKGNVGIGTTTTSDVDDNTAFAIPTATLFVKGGASAGGTCDVVIRGGVAGQEQGKAKLWLSADASHSSYIQSQHTGSGNTQLTFGVASGNALPTERMKIWNGGAVGIQSPYNSGAAGGYALYNNFMSAGSLTIGNIEQNYGNSTQWTANTAGFLMECLNNTEIVIHDAGNSLMSFMYYSGSAFTIGRNMGYGTANVNCMASLFAAGYILSRNSYDACILADGGGMYMKFGDGGTGNSTYLEISASSGATNINSGSNRTIYMRTFGFTWTYVNQYSYNPSNSYYWNITSDQRIKENIKKSNLKICFDNVKNINLYRYNYKSEAGKGTQKDKTQLGFVAQQVEKYFPKSISREKKRLDNKKEVPDLCGVDIGQINMSLFGAVKQLIKVVEKQSKRIKKLEELLNIIDDDEVDNDADEPYERIVCDEVDIDTIEPSEPEGV